MIYPGALTGCGGNREWDFNGVTVCQAVLCCDRQPSPFQFVLFSNETKLKITDLEFIDTILVKQKVPTGTDNQIAHKVNPSKSYFRNFKTKGVM